MDFQYLYGRQKRILSFLPDEGVVRLDPLCPTPPDNAAALVRSALANPIGSPPLREIARGRRRVAILGPGKDRVAGVSILLPVLLDELNAAGVPDEAVEITLATGTHARHTAGDFAAIVGADVAARIRWRHHDARAAVEQADLGTTRAGTPIRLDRAIIDADLKILTGRIIPHYFAGFGGGRKAILPGVAGLDTILANHRLTLDPGGTGFHPGVRPCSLAHNPVHLDMLEAAGRVEGTFVVNTLLDADHQLVGVVAGGLAAAHETGCRLAGSMLRRRVTQPFDAVIGVAGGWPYDIDFIQALKTAFNIAAVVRPGGALLWIAECAGGIKEGFDHWAGIPDDGALNRAVRARYNLAGHNAIRLRELCRRVRVALWSDLPADAVRRLGLVPIRSESDAAAWLAEACPSPRRWALAPCANVISAEIDDAPEGKAS